MMWRETISIQFNNGVPIISRTEEGLDLDN